MKTFIAKHRQRIKGVLHCFDRVILRGHLPIAGLDYFMAWLTDKRIGLNLRQLPEQWRNFKDAAPWFAQRVKSHAQAMAAQAGRPYQHLSSQQKMESNARALAERDGITHGLVCVYSTLEKCRTFRVRFTPHGPKLGPDLRVCLVLYYYWMDPQFGLIHVKIETWFPFTVQVYVNGHEFLARKLERRGISFRKLDNTFVDLQHAAQAQRCARAFWRRDWPKLLDGWARRVNPLLVDWLAGQTYYWVIDQAEISTDVLFSDRATLTMLRPRLYEHAAMCFSAPQVMTFLGRRFRESFAGEVTTRWHRREPGASVKHWVKRNALKMYDKAGCVLRIETVINNPREFRVHRPRKKWDGTEEIGWFPMSKGVANLYRYAEVGQRANERYLEALAVVDDLGVSQGELERRSAAVSYEGRRCRALHVLGRDDQALFQATLRGEHALRGFRNGELAMCLYGAKPEDPVEKRKRCGRVSRRIRLLRAHGLVAKFPRSRRYRVTASGQRFMSTAIHVRTTLFARAATNC